MSKRYPEARYTLPLNITPSKTRCFVIRVPDDIYYVAAFRGQLEALAHAYSWSNDSAHTALLVAKVWREVLDRIETCSDVPLGLGGAEGEDNLIRQNPDNPCELQTSIDGTHWCTFADLSLCVPAGSQPGSGSQQPLPNGGEACYHAAMSGSNKWLLPYQVNAGDVITISNASGAASDGTTQWYCPNGLNYFLGSCNGSTFTSSGDVANTLPHMSLIAKIGSVYYEAYNTGITVPSGISNANVEFQLNDGSLSDNYGDITFDACVTNNAASTFSHTFDFLTGDHGWQPWGTNTVYTSGVGFEGICYVYQGTDRAGLIASVQYQPLRSFTMSSFDILYDRNLVDRTGDQGDVIQANTTTNLSVVFPLSGTGSNLHMAWSGTQTVNATSDSLRGKIVFGAIHDVPSSCPISGASGRIKAITITGIGTDPFV